jgi:lipopolysaccharide heptosyltransferase I
MPTLNAQRILISRQSAIGDCILTAPLLCALRDHFPKAFIAWAVEPAAATLLKNHRSLDRLVIVKKGWLKSPTAVLALRRELRSLEFDTTIDPQSLSKSTLVAWLTGAKQRIGFARPHGRELSPWLNNVLVTKTLDHVVDHQLELLKVLGASSTAVRFDLPQDPSARAIADAFVHGSRFDYGYAVINPGAGWDSRLWPVERFAKVARHLGDAHRLNSVVVWSGEREQEWAEEIVAASRGFAVMAPRTSLPELAAILRNARLFVGSDTGPLHLAAGVGTPCVSMHGTTRREQSGPYGTRHVALQAYFQSGSSRERRRTTNEAMLAISEPLVCQACDRVLNSPQAISAA